VGHTSAIAGADQSRETTVFASIVASEGGYQQFELGGGEMAVLLLSVLAALMAIAVGFQLMRGVLAAEQGTPKMI
jgi:K(+)-stimulated pyrophosphate-energized sodium pump